MHSIRSENSYYIKLKEFNLIFILFLFNKRKYHKFEMEEFLKATVLETQPLLQASLYAGSDGFIIMSREYFIDWTCDYDLVYYPFDTQV